MHRFQTHTLFGLSAAEPRRVSLKKPFICHLERERERKPAHFGLFVCIFAQPPFDLRASITDRRLLSITSTCADPPSPPPHSSALSNSANIPQRSCGQLIADRNNNHKHIKQIKDRLPKHSAQPFIIMKSAEASLARASPAEEQRA